MGWVTLRFRGVTAARLKERTQEFRPPLAPRCVRLRQDCRRRVRADADGSEREHPYRKVKGFRLGTRRAVAIGLTAKSMSTSTEPINAGNALAGESAAAQLLEKLVDFEPTTFPVLSVYLNMQPDQHGRTPEQIGRAHV